MGQTEAIIKIILLLLTIAFSIWWKFKQRKIAKEQSQKIGHDEQSKIPSENSQIQSDIDQSDSDIDDILGD